MRRHLHRDLERLEHELLAQSSMVEEMIDKACLALARIRPDIAAEVIAQEGRRNRPPQT